MAIRIYLADILTAPGRSRGIGQFTEDIIAELERGDHQQNLVYVISKSSIAPTRESSRVIRIPLNLENRPLRMIVDNFHPLVVSNQNVHAWHYLKGYLPFVRPKKVPVIATVHDTIVDFYQRYYPDSRNRLNLRYWTAALRRTVRHAARILTSTEFSKRQIQMYADRERIPVPDIHVVPLGSSAEYFDSSLIEKSDFALHLGSVLQHKGTEWLISVWLDFQKRGLQLPPLLIVGALSKESLNLVSSCQNVRVVPHQPRNALLRLLAEARVLLLPSEIEGFGLPALESYYVGTPVCFVAGTSIEEIIGSDAPGKFELRQADSLFSALQSCLEVDRNVIASQRTRLLTSYSLNTVGRSLLKQYQHFDPA